MISWLYSFIYIFFYLYSFHCCL